MVCLGIRQLLFMNIVIILNECAINDIIIMGYSVCVALCRTYLCKHNWWKIHIYSKTSNPPPQKKKLGWGFLRVFIFWVFFFWVGFFNASPGTQISTHSNTAICQLVTSARVVLEIIHLAQHKHNGSHSTRWDAWASSRWNICWTIIFFFLVKNNLKTQ